MQQRSRVTYAAEAGQYLVGVGADPFTFKGYLMDNGESDLFFSSDGRWSISLWFWATVLTVFNLFTYF